MADKTNTTPQSKKTAGNILGNSRETDKQENSGPLREAAGGGPSAPKKANQNARKIGREATINFQGSGGNVSGTVSEERSHAADVSSAVNTSQNIGKAPTSSAQAASPAPETSQPINQEGTAPSIEDSHILREAAGGGPNTPEAPTAAVPPPETPKSNASPPAQNVPSQPPSSSGSETPSRISGVAKGLGKIALFGAGPTVFGALRGNQNQEAQSTQGSQDSQAQTPGFTGKLTDEDVRRIMTGEGAPAATPRAEPTTPASRKAPGAASTAVRKGGKVLMYTSPGAFVMGKLFGRKKERDAAAEQVENVEKEARAQKASKPKRPNFFSKPARGAGKVLWYASGAGMLHWGAGKLFPKQTHAFDSFFKRKKTTTSQNEGQRSHHPSSHYQNQWNNWILQKTAAQRAFIKENLQRFLKTRAWKYGKYLVSPIGAAAYDLTKRYQRRDAAIRRQGQKNEDWYMGLSGHKPQDQHASLHTKNPLGSRRIASAGKGFFKYTTPVGNIGAGWNKWAPSNWNSRLGRRFGNAPSPRNIAKSAQKKATSAAANIGKKAVTQVAKAFFRTPPGWATLGVIGGLFLVFAFITLIPTLFGGGGNSNIGGSPGGGGTPGGSLPSTPVENPIPGFTLSKSASAEILDAPTEITYTISYSLGGSIQASQITIYDELPANTTLVSGKTSGDFTVSGTTISWPLSSTQNSSPITFTVMPTKNDVVISNQAYALAAQTPTTGGSGNLSGLLPDNITSSPKTESAQQTVVNSIAGATSLIDAYKFAEQKTGVPWQVLAGIHFREGSLNPNASLVSGRPIGERELDIERGGGCSATYTEGEPVALEGGGCGFKTFADSVVYAANHFKAKNGGSSPASFQELAKSLSYYNGGGNANCGEGTPYTKCPPEFTGDDDTYVMNLFDLPHEQMYIIYCADFTRCNPAVPDQRLGVASVIMGLSKYLQNE